MNLSGSWRREFSAPLNALQGELNRLIAQYRNLGPIGPTPSPADATEIDPTAWVPAVDLVESAESIVLWADVPGVDPASIELAVTGRVLTLKGEKPPLESGQGRSHTLERPYGPFHLQVTLPSEVDVEQIAAEARDGVLRVTLPKSEAVRPRTIPIKSSG